MFQLPVLNFSPTQIKDLMSPEQLYFHYEKHHLGYISKVNDLISGDHKDFANRTLEEICKNSEKPLLNQAQQAWNHTFFWECIATDHEGVQIPGELIEGIEKSFDSLKKFEEEFKSKAVGIFGSGWIWLVAKPDGKLELLPASNSDQPFWNVGKPVLVCDVWEHAYYLDYKNERKKFIDSFWSHIQWDFVNRCYLDREIFSATERMSDSDQIGSSDRRQDRGVNKS